MIWKGVLVVQYLYTLATLKGVKVQCCNVSLSIDSIPAKIGVNLDKSWVALQVDRFNVSRNVRLAGRSLSTYISKAYQMSFPSLKISDDPGQQIVLRTETSIKIQWIKWIDNTFVWQIWVNRWMFHSPGTIEGGLGGSLDGMKYRAPTELTKEINNCVLMQFIEKEHLQTV